MNFFRLSTALALLLPGICASGSELWGEPYVLRLVATLQRASNYASAAGMQATAAHPAGWSVNPAADDVLHDPDDPRNVTLTATNMHAFAETGAWITASAATASIRSPDLGTMPIAYARTDTIDGQTSRDFDNPLRSNEFFWGYSKRLSDACAIGLQTRYVNATIQEETIAAPLYAPLRFETDLLWHVDFTVGLRWAISPEWSIGLLGGEGWGRAAVDARNIVPLPNPFPPPASIPPDTLLFDLKDSLRSRVARLGVGYTPNEWLGIYADGEYFHLHTSQTGNIDVTRAMLGAEVRPSPCHVLRLGGGVNNFGQFTFSTGAGVNPSDYLGLELAYQYNAYPELDLEFGRLDLLTLSGVVQF